MSLSEELATLLFNIRTLSDKDIIQIKKLLLDFLAATYAGYQVNRKFNICVEKVVFDQKGKEEASVLLHTQKLPAKEAAFMNALYGHGAELDDGNRKAMGHVGVHVIPAVLALAESEKKNQDEVMLAIVCGYEAYIRVSSAAQPGMVNRSFHSTGIAGAIGCAAACAKILGLSAEMMENSMSLASTMSSGLLTYSESRQMIKPINPAKAAETGVFAARLAKAGVLGPLNFLEGPNGWFHAVADMVNTESLLIKNKHWLIHECYFKLFPSCRHTHGGIEAAIALHDLISLKEIERVDVFIYPNAIKLAGHIMFPKDEDETKFSIYYTFAIALLYGEYGIRYMKPPILNERVVDLIRKIHLISDEGLENKTMGIRGVRVEVHQDNKVIEKTVLIPKGDPENPLSFGDLKDKFKVCSTGILEEERVRDIIDYVSCFGGDEEINTTIFFNG